MQSDIRTDISDVRTSNDRIAAELALKRLEKELNQATLEKQAIQASTEARTNGDALTFIGSCAASLVFTFGIAATWEFLFPDSKSIIPIVVFGLILMAIPTVTVITRNRQTKQHILGVKILAKEYDLKISQLKREIHRQRKVVES